MVDISRLNFKSTWGLQSEEMWGALRDTRWKDFALSLGEVKSEMDAKGIEVLSGEVKFSSQTAASKIKGVLQEYLTNPTAFSVDTEMSIAIFVSVVDFYKKLMYFLPWYDEINPTFQNICRVLDISFRYLEEQVSRVERNLDQERAIELLSMYEKTLGIVTNVGLSHDQRRRQIQATLLAMRQQTTPKLLKALCSAFSDNNSGVEINQTETPGVFEIKFVSGGLPNNLDGLESLLKKTVPADLEWRYAYTQNPWSDITKKRLRWGDVVENNWQEVNTYKEV